MKLFSILFILSMTTSMNQDEGFLKAFYQCVSIDHKVDLLCFVSLEVENKQYIIDEYKDNGKNMNSQIIQEYINCINNDSPIEKKPIKFIYHHFYQGKVDQIKVAATASMIRDSFMTSNDLEDVQELISIYSKEGDVICELKN